MAAAGFINSIPASMSPSHLLMNDRLKPKKTMEDIRLNERQPAVFNSIDSSEGQLFKLNDLLISDPSAVDASV